VVDNLNSSEKWKNLVELSFEDYVHKNKFIEMIKNETFAKSFRAIIHLGARSSTTEKMWNF